MTEVKGMGYVKDGAFTTVLRTKLEAEMKQLKDGDYNISIKRAGRRSDPQNRYMWGCIIPMLTAEFKRLGNDVDDETTHTFLKEKFNPKYIRNDEGTVIHTIGGSTTQFDKAGMMEYLDKIVLWSLETLGLNIPPPTGYDFLDFEPKPKKELVEVRSQYGTTYEPLY